MARPMYREWRPNGKIRPAEFRDSRFADAARARGRDCQAVLPADGIICCDVGVSHNWYMQFWNARKPQSMLNSWGFSGMGFGAAGALGANLRRPTVRWSRLPATAASPWCRMCFAPRSSTTSRWSG